MPLSFEVNEPNISPITSHIILVSTQYYDYKRGWKCGQSYTQQKLKDTINKGQREEQIMGAISSFGHNYSVAYWVGWWALAGKQKEWHYQIYNFEKSLRLSYEIWIRGNQVRKYGDQLGGWYSNQMKTKGGLD